MTDFIPGEYLDINQVLEKASIVEAFSNGSVQVTLYIHETIAGIKYDRKVGRWFDDQALNLLNEYRPSEGWRFRIEKHPGGKWHLWPMRKEGENHV